MNNTTEHKTALDDAQLATVAGGSLIFRYLDANGGTSSTGPTPLTPAHHLGADQSPGTSMTGSGQGLGTGS